MDSKEFPQRSALISPALEQQLGVLLERLTQPVELTCLVDAQPLSVEMGAFLNHLASLCSLLHCRFLRPGEQPQLDEALDASLLPATGIAAPGTLPRMVFHGTPGGKEINAFAAALLSAGGAAKPLDRPTLKDIGKIQSPLHIQVCVSLGCQHCAQLVSHAQRIAWENPMVSAHMIDANRYPALVEQYQIQRVPLTILNGTRQIPGGKTMAELTTLLSRR